MAGFDLDLRSGAPAIHAFSRDDYLRLGEIGLLNDRTELIEGVIFDLSPQGPLHASKVARLNRLFQRLLDDRFLLFAQSDVVLSARSQPVPDLAVLQFRDDFYETRLPGPEDIHLAVEVADSTLAHDRAKAGLYAASGIPEYWLIDVRAAELLVHRQPLDGRYLRVDGYRSGDTVEALIGISFAVSDFL